MKITVGELKALIREASVHESLGTNNFSFEVYGPNDETYVCTATYDARRPFEVEVWKATTEDGTDVDVDDLRALGIDLEEKAFDHLGKDGDDGIGLDYDDIHGKSGIDY